MEKNAAPVKTRKARVSGAALSPDKRCKRKAEEEPHEELLNAPSLLPLSGISSSARPPKRRRLAPLRLPEAWQSAVKEIFHVREAPKPCRETFKSKVVPVTSGTDAAASGSITFGNVSTPSSSGSIFTGSSGGSAGSIFGATSGASAGASSGSIFGASSGGSIFGSSGSTSTFGAASAGSNPTFGASGGLFGAGSAFGAAPAAGGQPSMFAQAFQQSRPGPGGARRRRR
eukprot:Skav220397  [mRNA]  locus=scaffold639:342950:343636:- [translate_table: standard]